VHLHDHVEPSEFVSEWSCYDAGITHVRARGTVDAPFQRMNHPNRVVPYLAAGLPLAQHSGGQRAMERFVARTGAGFLYRDYDELADILADRALITRLRSRAEQVRRQFSFEHRAGDLAEILHRAAERHSQVAGGQS
jgi:hypothetical protein